MQPQSEIISRCIDQSQCQKLVSLPLQFAYLAVDVISKQFTKLNSPHEHRIHYLGPRYTNTQTMHKKCSFTEPTPLCAGVPDRKVTRYKIDVKRIVNSFFINERLRTNHFYKTGLYYRAFEGMNPTLDSNQQIIFNGSFESANLDCVIKYKPREYDLFLRIDSNTRGHLQWFYFSISNGHKMEKIKLNICNISKPGTLYETEMQPYIFSKKQFETKNITWTQGSPQISNVNFSQKPLNYKILTQKITNNPYCYSFQYQFTHQNDEVFFAYCIPYTYSELLADIELLPKNLVHVYTVGRTLTGVQIPLLNITDHSTNTADKRNILITGRIHPGQSNSSHILKGFINYLCSSERPAVQLRKQVNFYIIPMLNPDGVILGNSRCSASGRDLNRIFPSSDKQLFPEIYYLKSFTQKFTGFHEIMMYYDFHGHSRKKNTFFYGPAYPLSNPNYLKCRVLPRIIQKINSSFRYHSCQFSISESKKTTGRAAMFEIFQIPYTYTVQSSIGYYYDCDQLKTFSFGIESYNKMGASICEGTSTFVSALNQYDNFLRDRRAERQRRRNKNTGKRTDKFVLPQDQSLDTKGPTLKIYYKQDCLFVKLLQQIKTLPQTIQKVEQEEQMEMDKQASSDDHDDKQDFQVTKLKQFNNLIIQNARKDNLMSNLPESQNNKDDLKAFVRSNNHTQGNMHININTNNMNNSLSRSQRNWEYEEQMDLLEQINTKTKSKSSHGSRARNTSLVDERSTTRTDIKRKIMKRGNDSADQKAEFFNFHESQGNCDQVDFQIQGFYTEKVSLHEKRSSKIRNSTVSRSTAGYELKLRQQRQKDIQRQRQRQKQRQRDREKQREKVNIHHFGEMHFPEQQRLEQKKILRHQKTDLFRRNIERKREREDKTRMQKINCSELTILKNPKKQVMNYESIKKSKKMTQFKIDDLMTNLQFRSKMLKDSVKYKEQSKVKSNCMFPSSFYCMRQQLNTKKRNNSYNNARTHSQSVEEPLSIMVKQYYK